MPLERARESRTVAALDGRRHRDVGKLPQLGSRQTANPFLAVGSGDCGRPHRRRATFGDPIGDHGDPGDGGPADLQRIQVFRRGLRPAPAADGRNAPSDVPLEAVPRARIDGTELLRLPEGDRTQLHGDRLAGRLHALWTQRGVEPLGRGPRSLVRTRRPRLGEDQRDHGQHRQANDQRNDHRDPACGLHHGTPALRRQEPALIGHHARRRHEAQGTVDAGHAMLAVAGKVDAVAALRARHREVNGYQ